MGNERLHDFIKWITHNKSLFILNGLLLIFILVCAWLKPIDNLKDYDISRQSGNASSTELVYGGRSVWQTFVCTEEADSFELNLYVANTSYHGTFYVRLYDAENNLIQGWETDKLDLTEEWIDYRLGKAVMYQGEIYCIEITAPQLDMANAVKVKLISHRDKYSDVDQPVYTDGQLYLDGQATDKTLQFAVYKDTTNGYAWISIVIMFVTMNFWWFHRRKPIEWIAPFVLSGLGVVMLVCFTPSSGPDEVYHYYSAYEISNVILGIQNVGEIEGEHESCFSEHDNTNKKFVYVMRNIFGDEELNKTELGELGEQEAFEYNDHKDLLGSPSSHLMPALGMTVARLLNMNVAQLFMMARLFNLTFYVAVATFAIRLIPKNKELLFMISITPLTLHQAAQTSYDVIINGLSLVFVAYILKIIYEKDPVKWSSVFLCIILLGIFGPVKVVYCVLALLFVAIPGSQFQSKMDRVAKNVTVILGTFLIVVLTKWQDLIPRMTGTSKRTIKDSYSISFIFEHPIRFFELVARSFENSAWEWTKGDALAGHRVPVPEYLVIGFMLLIFICAMNGKDENPGLLKWQKAVFVSTSLAGAGLTIFAAFEWTTYGSYYVSGVQGRYMIPFLMAIPFCFCNRKLETGIDKRMLMYPMWFIEAGYIVSIMSQVMF